MTASDSSFRAAIPGSSIAHHKLGNLPHEKPPKYVDANEALEYIWKQFHRPDVLRQIWYILEKGADVRSVVNAILYKAASSGLIQGNLAVVIAPTVAKMIMTLGKARGIDGIKLMPKMRDKVKDMRINDMLNKHLGNTSGGKQIPPSAMKTMLLPKAEDITKGHQAMMQTAPSAPSTMPSQGLLSQVGK